MKFKKIASALLAFLLLASSAAPVVSALEPHGTGIKMRQWLTNDPNYTFSEEYKTSVWYENFTSLELTENDRNNILRIAVSQLGYHEGDSAKDFDGMNRNGSSNYIEYARLLVPHYNNNAYEWCACFVNWCLNQARFDKASSEIGCWKWVGELKTMKMWQDSAAYKGTYTPKPADMIFFNWKGTNTTSGHIGYVLYTTETHVFTLEGNADNNVTVRSYSLNDPCVIGYGTPPYNEGNEPTIDYSYADGMPRGTYVVNSYTAVLRKEATGGGRVCNIPAGSAVVLEEVVDNMARVRYGDNVGYLPTNILYLMTLSAGEDTLTYDANGGTGAPEAQKVIIGEPHALSDTLPSLEGDTFLGWSLTPYSAIPEFKAGDPISLDGDTTLYAVWEKHSVELANAAFAEGKAPAFARPDTITNSSAILSGTLSDLSALTGTDTDIMFFTDGNHGKVLALTSTAESADPYVTLAYGELMKSLRLAPVTGETAAYVVLKVKNVSMNNTAVELCFNGSDAKITSLLASGNDWQYLVFDLTDTGSFEGELNTLRIDWEKAANEAGNTMYLSDIYFVPTSEQVKALTAGVYIYPTQELTESETEVPTEPETEIPTEEPTAAPTEPATEVPTEALTEPVTEVPTEAPTDAPTAVPTDTPAVSDTETAMNDPDGGCFAAIGISAATCMMVICAAAVLRKKKD